ncbi:MAG: hypothetical protein QM737_15285 [Ferruginibacter sp.]
MKRFYLSILLFTLIIPAYIHAGVVYSEINKTTLKNSPVAYTYLKKDFHHTGGIGTAHFHFYHRNGSKTNHGFQRLAVHLPDNEKTVFTASLHFCLENYTLAEHFGNSYLSHIYPFHNFW